MLSVLASWSGAYRGTRQGLKHEGVGSLFQGLGIYTKSVSGYSSCSVQFILRDSIILESEGGDLVNLYWAGGGKAMGDMMGVSPMMGVWYVVVLDGGMRQENTLHRSDQVPTLPLQRSCAMLLFRSQTQLLSAPAQTVSISGLIFSQF